MQEKFEIYLGFKCVENHDLTDLFLVIEEIKRLHINSLIE